MDSRKRMVVLSGVLLFVILCGCSRMFWNVDEDSGWYVKLNVGDPGARAIVVGEYEVTRLEITVQGPGIQDPVSIVWHAADGPQSYIVQVSDAGTHRIDVTHISDANGEVVQATESAEFDIEPMEITVINITPGAVGMIGVEPGERDTCADGEPRGGGRVPACLPGLVVSISRDFPITSSHGPRLPVERANSRERDHHLRILVAPLHVRVEVRPARDIHSVRPSLDLHRKCLAYSLRSQECEGREPEHQC